MSVKITGVEAALPVLRSAVDILRELARDLGPRVKLADRQMVDVAADQIENLADHLEIMGREEIERAKYQDWSDWFAWHPVRLLTFEIAWFRWVKRRPAIAGDFSFGAWDYCNP